MNARTNIEHLQPPVARRRFTVEEFHKMGEAGILHEDSRVELIDGVLITMAPIGAPHASTVDTLTSSLAVKFVNRGIVRIQNPIWLSDDTEPEADVVIAKPLPGGYRKSHPRPEDILLIIEVADTTLDYDRKVKMPLYGEHGIPEAWLVDLNEKRVEIYLEPSADGYQKMLRPGRDAVIAPACAPDVQISLSELFS